MPKIKERVKLNPFMEEFGRGITQKDMRVTHRMETNFMDIDTGESLNSHIDKKLRQAQDLRHFVKILDCSLDIVMNLSPASYRLYYWILKQLDFGDDYVTIYGSEVQIELGYKSINSIHRAIDGLIESNMIAPKWGSPWYFFINPNIFYKGDMVKTYIMYAASKKLNKNVVKGESTFKPINPDFLDPADSDVLSVNESDNVVQYSKPANKHTTAKVQAIVNEESEKVEDF